MFCIWHKNHHLIKNDKEVNEECDEEVYEIGAGNCLASKYPTMFYIIMLLLLDAIFSVWYSGPEDQGLSFKDSNTPSIFSLDFVIFYSP